MFKKKTVVALAIALAVAALLVILTVFEGPPKHSRCCGPALHLADLEGKISAAAFSAFCSKIVQNHVEIQLDTVSESDLHGYFCQRDDGPIWWLSKADPDVSFAKFRAFCRVVVQAEPVWVR